jgi:Ca2+-binding RTX toxin-like protein
MRISRILLVALLLTLVSSAVAAGGEHRSKKCHGEEITLRGTDRDDSVNHPRIESGDVIALGDGDDRVNIEDERNVTVCGGEGNDSLGFGDGGASGRGILFDGEKGNDSAVGSFSDEPLHLIGGPGFDFLEGGGAGDLLKGGPGRDRLSAHGGEDQLDGGAGNDDISGGYSHDSLFGRGGNDTIYGGSDAGGGLGDKADGGRGRDFCDASIRHHCESH